MNFCKTFVFVKCLLLQLSSSYLPTSRIGHRMVHLLPQTYLVENRDSEPESWGNVKCILQTGMGCVGMMREGPSVNGVEKRTGEIRDKRKANEKGEN